MSAQNPIRVAEETAILDHLTQGRTLRRLRARLPVALDERPRPAPRRRARPCPRRPHAEHRWPLLDRRSSPEQDRRTTRVNRDIFEEQVDIVLKAWTQRASIARGRLEIPFPYDEGIDWGDGAQATAAARAPKARSAPTARRAPRQRRPGAVQRPAPAGLRLQQRQPGDDRVLRPQGLHPDLLLQHRHGGASSARPTSRTRGRPAAATRSGQNQALVRWMQIGDDRGRGARNGGCATTSRSSGTSTAATPACRSTRRTRYELGHRLRAVRGRHVGEVRDQFVEQWQRAPGRVRRASSSTTRRCRTKP